MKFKKVSIILVLIIFSSLRIIAQKSGRVISKNGIALELRNDTLFSNAGISIFVGQKILLGQPAAQDRYRSILSKYAAIVPEIWGPNKRFENQFENYVDSKKGKASVRKLKQGEYLAVTAIGIMGDRKSSQYYVVLLSSVQDKYKCDISLALSLGELLIQ